jgi:hypothetical protein
MCEREKRERERERGFIDNQEGEGGSVTCNSCPSNGDRRAILLMFTTTVPITKRFPLGEGDL